MTTAEHAKPRVRHPLDPLTAEEIAAASRILRRDRGLAASARFVYVTLREPAKDAVLRGEAVEREAHIVLRERAECRTYEAVVSITAGAVRQWREVPGVQPTVSSTATPPSTFRPATTATTRAERGAGVRRTGRRRA